MTAFNPGYYYPQVNSSLYSNDYSNQYRNYDEQQNYSFNNNNGFQQPSSIWDFINQLMQLTLNNQGGGFNSNGNSLSNSSVDQNAYGNSLSNSSTAQSSNGNANSQANQFNIFRPIFNIIMPPQQEQQQQQQIPQEIPQTIPQTQTETPVQQPTQTPTQTPAQTSTQTETPAQTSTEQPAKQENKGIDWGAIIGGYVLMRIALYPILSPVSVDLNGDGKVSGQAGKGVDLDGDGKADGAATNGDGMLAMGDVNGNGKIDGSEVFGDKTVDPFTGQAINAKNGYEAMQTVAKSAQQKTGINSMDQEGNVDLFKLREAIQKGTNNKGSLGFISDDNVTKLQSLESSNIQSINTNYKEQAYDQTVDVQHRQAAQATTRDGQQRLSEDLWFRKTA